MQLKHWMVAKTVVALAFGLTLVFIPGTFCSLYAIQLGPGGVFMTRLFGQAFIVIGIALWFARNTSEPAIQRAFAVAVLVGDAIGFIVTLMATLSGVQNALGWSSVALYLILALGFGYFLLPGAATP